MNSKLKRVGIYLLAVFVIYCLNFGWDNTAYAFENFKFNNTISCKKVVTTNGVMKYNGKINSVDNLNVEWISTGKNKGPNEITVEASISSDKGNYSYTVVHKFNNKSKTYKGACTIKVNEDDIGKHYFTIKANVNNKEMTKKVIANVVKSTQAVASIKYRTVAIKAKQILSNDRTTVKQNFPGNPNLELSNMNFTDAALNTIDSKFPNKLKTGKSYYIVGNGIIEVYKGNNVLNKYNLNTQFKKLLSDYSWGEASIRDFESKKSLECTYNSELQISYPIEYVNLLTKQAVDIVENKTHSLKNYEIVTSKSALKNFNVSTKLYKSNLQGEVQYISTDLYKNNKIVYTSSNGMMNLNFTKDGVYNYDFTQKLCDGVTNLKIVYGFIPYQVVTPQIPATKAPVPTPKPTPKPTAVPIKTPVVTVTPIVTDAPLESEFELKVSGAINYWKNQKNRFLSLEEVSFVVKSNVADKVIIRLSPPLEAMEYVDEKGNVYDYKSDFFGEYIYFPDNSTVSLSGTKEAIWSYHLPLAKSTLNWEGERLLTAYSVTAYFYRGNELLGTRTQEIEITGNIYDILHVQP